MSLLITGLFIAATAFAYGGQFLDWYNTEKGIAAHGIASEKNPIMRFIFGKSKWLAFAFKMGLPTAVIIAALGYGDIKYWNVQYLNAPAGHVDKWAIGWIIAQLLVGGFGAIAYAVSSKEVKL